MATKIDTVKARSKLAERREPYWHRISRGNYIGFRKMTADTDGSWVARAFIDHERRQAYNALGDFSDLPDHERFDAASKAAQEWFAHLDKGGNARGTTIRDVCERYVDHLRENKKQLAAKDAAARFKAYVLDDPRFAALDVAKLTPLAVEAWRKSLRDRPTRSGGNRGRERTASSLNRDMTSFRAALNLAYDDGLVTSDFAWRSKLKPIKDADRSRNLYLDKDERRRLIVKAPPDLADFLRGLCLLPLRPGALAALTVRDFDRRLRELRIGIDKAGHERKIKLPVETAQFFAEHTKDKLPGAPLLARADGKAWSKDYWKGPIKEAVRAAYLPGEPTAYTLRHSTITDLVHDGLDLLTVAQVSGTSVRMIEKHYGHQRGNVTADALAKLAL